MKSRAGEFAGNRNRSISVQPLNQINIVNRGTQTVYRECHTVFIAGHYVSTTVDVECSAVRSSNGLTADIRCHNGGITFQTRNRAQVADRRIHGACCIVGLREGDRPATGQSDLRARNVSSSFISHNRTISGCRQGACRVHIHGTADRDSPVGASHRDGISIGAGDDSVRVNRETFAFDGGDAIGIHSERRITGGVRYRSRRILEVNRALEVSGNTDLIRRAVHGDHSTRAAGEREAHLVVPSGSRKRRHRDVLACRRRQTAGGISKCEGCILIVSLIVQRIRDSRAGHLDNRVGDSLECLDVTTFICDGERLIFVEAIHTRHGASSKDNRHRTGRHPRRIFK